MGALLERMAREAQAQAPKVRDTIQEGRQEVLDALGVPPPGAPTPPEPGPVRQRDIRTVEVRRGGAEARSSVPWLAFGIGVAIFALLIGIAAFVMMRALG